MSLYDTIQVGDREGQVKLWDCEMRYYKIGDKDGYGIAENYSIAMREGGYVNIHDHRIVSWTNEPANDLVLDKYGAEFNPDTFQGLMGEAGFGKESYFSH